MNRLPLTLLAVVAVSCAYMAYRSTPTYELTANFNGQSYIMDHDLTYEDCQTELRTYTSFTCTRS